MSFDLSALSAAVAREGRVARVVVAAARGSAPREAGAAMLVWAGGQEGTIGGGALEYEAATKARSMLDAGGAKLDRLALGPALQQCCGGAVTLLTEVYDDAALARVAPEAGLFARAVTPGAPEPLAVQRRLSAARGQGQTGGITLVDGWAIEPVTRATRALWIWGAGHVGRAIVSVLAPLPEIAVTWVDTAAERFPETLPDGVERVVAADPATLVPFAPKGAEHLILTYSHALDLALCHALLTRGFAEAGLIGSATKWTRFRRRLAELGHGAPAIARIRCPIGDPALGKHPQAIAISVAASILARASAAISSKEGAG